MATIINLEELRIGVYVEEMETTTFFKDLTEATLHATEKINKGYTIKMLYCDKYGCEIKR